MQKTYTLATKLYATFGGVLTLSLLLALLSWYSIKKTEDILDRSCKVTARKTVLAGEISESGNQMLSAQRGVIMNTLAGRLDQVGPLKEDFEQNVKRMEKAIEQITPLLVTDCHTDTDSDGGKERRLGCSSAARRCNTGACTECAFTEPPGLRERPGRVPRPGGQADAIFASPPSWPRDRDRSSR